MCIWVTLKRKKLLYSFFFANKVFYTNIYVSARAYWSSSPDAYNRGVVFQHTAERTTREKKYFYNEDILSSIDYRLLVSLMAMTYFIVDLGFNGRKQFTGLSRLNIYK